MTFFHSEIKRCSESEFPKGQAWVPRANTACVGAQERCLREEGPRQGTARDSAETFLPPSPLCPQPRQHTRCADGSRGKPERHLQRQPEAQPMVTRGFSFC